MQKSFLQSPRSAIARALIACLIAVVISSCQMSSAIVPESEQVTSSASSNKPQLVVVISVDGLRGDLPYRYQPYFSGGFKRLLEQGFHYSKAAHDHGNTFTAPGHSTIATGVHPSRHGVIANSWREQQDGQWADVGAVEDHSYPLLLTGEVPGASPHRLMRSSLGDWLVASSPQSQVVSVGGKDRSAILLAGQKRHQVFWFDDDFEGFGSSEYYYAELPSWVSEFNDQILDKYPARDWQVTAPRAARALARADASPYENDGEHSTFPHTIEAWFGEKKAAKESTHYKWLEDIPTLDQITLDFAQQAIAHYRLGKGGHPDLLNIGLSATDRVGHGFGPDSLEQLDNLLQLDQHLGDFMDFLDQQVGTNNYLLVLSADHGFNTIPEHRAERGLPGNRFTSKDAQALALQLTPLLETEPMTEAVVRQVVEQLEASPLVERIFSEAALTTQVELGSDPTLELFQRSYYPGRYDTPLAELGLMLLNPEEGSIQRKRGTTHGSAHWYDRHVPLIFFGTGIEAGTSDADAHTVDIAPSIAKILALQVPVPIDGRTLQ